MRCSVVGIATGPLARAVAAARPAAPTGHDHAPERRLRPALLAGRGAGCATGGRSATRAHVDRSRSPVSNLSCGLFGSGPIRSGEPSATISNSSFVDNRAFVGGAISVCALQTRGSIAVTPSLTVVNSSFSGKGASFRRGRLRGHRRAGEFIERYDRWEPGVPNSSSPTP